MKAWQRLPGFSPILGIQGSSKTARFCKNRYAGLRSKLPYLEELGLTYLHLMPLFKAPEGENDGGYAVSSYREVNPRLGSMQRTVGPGVRVACAGHQPDRRLCLQPHFR